jgi:hypothetical protein
MSDALKGGGSAGAAHDGAPGPARPRPARPCPARPAPAVPVVGRSRAARGGGRDAGPRTGRRQAAGGARARRAP